MKRILLLSFFVLALCVSNAFAQGNQQCWTSNGSNCIKVGTGGGGSPLPVTIIGVPVAPQDVNITKILGNPVSVTNPLYIGIIQGGNTATVKASSTAPATTDPALVVSLGPNSYSYDGTVYNGTCSAACNGTAIIGPIDTTGTSYSGISIQTTVAGSGTLIAQGSNDNVTYSSLNCWQENTTNIPQAPASTNASFVGTQTCPIYGRYFRLQFTSYSSGTFTVVASGRTGPSTAIIRATGIVGRLPYPTNPSVGNSATPIIGAGSGSTGAVTATLAAVAGKTTYICGFDVSALGGIATVGPIVVGALIGGSSFTYQMSSLASGNTVSREFTPCIPANATATAITVVTTADGTATAVNANAHGYQY